MLIVFVNHDQIRILSIYYNLFPIHKKLIFHLMLHVDN
jgi:hypothetical protein